MPVMWTQAQPSAILNPMSSQATLPTRVVGRRRRSAGGLNAAAPFLDLVRGLRRGKPFIPKGLHRFRTFDESQAWSVKMMSRSRLDRQASVRVQAK